MHLPWEDIRVFLAAWEQGTLTAAAASLEVGQATVSRRIAALEERIGQRLFDRHRSGLLPTDAARTLHPHAARMAEQARLASAALSGLVAEPEGRVRVALPAGIALDLMPPVLAQLRARWPRVRLDLLVGNAMRDLTRHEADIAMRAFRPTAGDLVFRRMPSVPLGVFASSRYIAGLPEDAAEAELDWVQWSDEVGPILVSRYVSERLGGRPPLVTSNSFPALRAAVQQGLGCMLMPVFQGRIAGLSPVPVALPIPPPVPTFLVVPRALRSVPRVAVVVDFLTEYITRMAVEEGWQ